MSIRWFEMKRTARKAAWGLALLALVASPAAAEPGAVRPGRAWTVKHERGTEEIRQGARITVAVDRSRITYGPNCATHAIPVAGISEVIYRPYTHKRSEGAGRMFWKTAAWGHAGPLVAFAVIFPAYTISDLFSTTKHFVEVTWEADGNKRTQVFKVGKGEYSAFLAELKSATGKEWSKQ